jgi:hypothetical protein
MGRTSGASSACSRRCFPPLPGEAERPGLPAQPDAAAVSSIHSCHPTGGAGHFRRGPPVRRRNPPLRWRRPVRRWIEPVSHPISATRLYGPGQPPIRHKATAPGDYAPRTRSVAVRPRNTDSHSPRRSGARRPRHSAHRRVDDDHVPGVQPLCLQGKPAPGMPLVAAYGSGPPLSQVDHWLTCAPGRFPRRSGSMRAGCCGAQPPFRWCR